MTPTEVKALTPGTVLATKPFMRSSTRVVVASVQPRGKRGMDVVGEDGKTYRDDDLLVPTPEIEARWAKAAAVLAQRQAMHKEMQRVATLLGVKPQVQYATDWPHEPDQYTVTLKRPEAVALANRIEALEAPVGLPGIEKAQTLMVVPVQLPQRQDALMDQLRTLHSLAVRAGCNDAADWLRDRLPALQDPSRSRT